jgi:hypothetical protein
MHADNLCGLFMGNDFPEAEEPGGRQNDQADKDKEADGDAGIEDRSAGGSAKAAEILGEGCDQEEQAEEGNKKYQPPDEEVLIIFPDEFIQLLYEQSVIIHLPELPTHDVPKAC